RSKRDWSSDVCSSDLPLLPRTDRPLEMAARDGRGVDRAVPRRLLGVRSAARLVCGGCLTPSATQRTQRIPRTQRKTGMSEEAKRSEERRVGKESRKWS